MYFFVSKPNSHKNGTSSKTKTPDCPDPPRQRRANAGPQVASRGWPILGQSTRSPTSAQHKARRAETRGANVASYTYIHIYTRIIHYTQTEQQPAPQSGRAEARRQQRPHRPRDGQQRHGGPARVLAQLAPDSVRSQPQPPAAERHHPSYRHKSLRLTERILGLLHEGDSPPRRSCVTRTCSTHTRTG